MNKKDKFRNEIKILKNISLLLDGLYMDDIEKLEEMVESNAFKVAVIGGFSAGKTTFLNAFIGRRLLYSSATEATGNLTFIQNSDDKEAVIEFSDERTEKIDLSHDDAYEELIQYLNKNSASKAKSISMKYPIAGINKDVILVDTPGFEGVSKEEMNITKFLVKEANAVIFMVKHSGLGKNDLDILTGRLAEFGKIQTKEIFLIINKIGELYDIEQADEVEKDVERIVSDVKQHLRDNGLENIRVFALDSKDYLWAVDNDLYSYVKLKEGIKKILPQEEYLKRTKRFFDFKNTFIELFNDSNMERMLNENITDRIEAFIEIFNDEISERDSIEISNINDKVSQLEKEKGLILENRRKIVNTIKRHVSENKESFISSLRVDLSKEQHEDKRKILEFINSQFNSIAKLQDNNNIYKLIALIKKIVSQRENSYVEISSLFLNSLSGIVNNIFDYELSRITNVKLNYKFDIKVEKLNIDFTFKEKSFDEDIEKQLKNNIKTKESEISKKKKQILARSGWVDEQNKSEREITKLENSKRSKVAALGSKPEPVQRYRYETRTRRKWLLFKEEYEVKVPDGLDYTECDRWEKRKTEIIEQFNNMFNSENNKLDKIKEEIRKIDRIKSSIADDENQLNSMKESLRRYKENVKRIQEKYKQEFIEEKKNNIYIAYQGLLNANIDNLLNTVINTIDYNVRNINYNIEEQINNAMKNTTGILDDKITEFKNSFNEPKVYNRQAIAEFNELKEEYKEVMGVE